MKRLVEFALTQRALVSLFAILLSGAGWYAFSDLPIDAFPDVSPTQVKIIVKAPGMTPEEVENQITAPIELELLGIPRQTMLRSIAKYALTDITVDFAEGTDIYWARQQVAERLGAVWDNLPAGIEGGIAPMTTPLGEMFMFTVDGDLSLVEKRTVLDWIIRPALRTVPGVADVNSLGGFVRSFEVMPEPHRMAARGIDPLMLGAALAANNRNDGAGRMTEGEETLLVRSAGRIQTLDDVRAIVVDVQGGVPIRVADVATVRIGAITRYGAVTQDGRDEAVQGLVLGLRGANARDVVDGVTKKLDEISSALPDGVEVSVFYDRGELVKRAVGTVSTALAEATVLVVILLLLFLGDLRASLAVALVLPLSALATFILMRQFGMSANLMSLGGLAIAIGMLVDAGVVVVENVTSHLSEWQKTRRLPRLHVIYRAVREVSLPVASGIGIIIIVFFPLLTLQGLEGKLFTPVALTIVFALASSLLLSLTVIPVLSSFLLRKVTHEEPWLPRKLEAFYVPKLRWCLDHSGRVTAGAAVALVLTAIVYLFIGKSFMPTMDEGDIIVQLEKLPSITLEDSVNLDLRVEQAILDRVPEVVRIVARVGSDEIGMDPMGLNETDIFMVLKPKSEWRMGSKDELIDAIRLVLDEFPGIAYGFTQPIEMRVSEMLTGVRGDVAVKLFGPSLSELNRYTAQIAAELRTVDGSQDVFTSQNEGMQYFEVEVDRLTAGRLGLSVEDLQGILRAQLEGLPIGIVQEGAMRTPLLMRAAASIGASPTSFAALPISLRDGEQVPLGTLAKIHRTEGVVGVARERGQRFAVVLSLIHI